MTFEGVLPIWKPEGFTSHDVVAVARRSLQIKRIGHTGTLDPMVTGVLPLCIGRATRMVEYIQDLPKQYEAELTLGISTNTEDWTGEILEQVDSISIDQATIERVLATFVGEIEQIPPMFSALKQGGVKLYELARQGIEVERKVRLVQIFKLELIETNLEDKHPKIRFLVDCSKGTYIRTLCVDIGRKLGFPAMMSSLVRTRSGPFRREDCITIEELRAFQENEKLHALLVDEQIALNHLSIVTIPDWAALKLVQGQVLHRSRLPHGCYEQATTKLFRLYDDSNRFVGLFQFDEQTGNIVATKVFATPEQWSTTS